VIASAGPDDQVKYVSAGFDGILAKPFTLDELVAVLASAAR